MKKILYLTFISFAAISSFACGSKGDQTTLNLKSAIEREKGAMTKYEIYSQKAVQEGLYNIASLFQAVSNAEMTHIRNHQAILVLLGVTDFVPADTSVESKDTKANLVAAAEGETYEVTQMYPAFLKTATEEKQEGAAGSFDYALKSEKKHARLFTEALELLNITDDDSNVPSTWHLCTVCGDIYSSIDNVHTCEICGAPSAGFMRFGYVPHHNTEGM